MSKFLNQVSDLVVSSDSSFTALSKTKKKRKKKAAHSDIEDSSQTSRKNSDSNTSESMLDVPCTLEKRNKNKKRIIESTDSDNTSGAINMTSTYDGNNKKKRKEINEAPIRTLPNLDIIDPNTKTLKNKSGSCTLNKLSALYCNISKYEEFVKNLQIGECNILNHQRRTSVSSGKGLKHDSVMYRSLIKFLKEGNEIKFSYNYEPTDEDVAKIVKKLYKRSHQKYSNAVRNFIEQYKSNILTDLEDNGDIDMLLAPTFKLNEKYFYSLSKICILHCYKEFALCIYKGSVMHTNLKNIIYNELNDVDDMLNFSYSKLDNALSKYKYYLREITNKLIKNVKADMQPRIIIKQLEKRVNESELEESLVNTSNHSRNSSSFLQINISLTKLSQEEIKNIIGT